MPHAEFNRFDIAEAYYLLSHDYNCQRDIRYVRPNHWRVSLSRLRFRASPSFKGYWDLTENGRAIYRAAERRIWATISDEGD